MTTKLINECHECRNRDQLIEVISQFPGMISYLDTSLKYVFANRSYCEHLNLKQSEVVGKALEEVIGEEGLFSIRNHIEQVLEGNTVKFSQVSKTAHQYSMVYYTQVPHFDSEGQMLGFFCIKQDLNQGYLDREFMSHHIRHDNLTSLKNRVALHEYIEDWIKTPDSSHENCLIVLDLCRFRAINASMGHRVGDHVLCHVAYQLLGFFPPTSQVFRLAGDEFAIWVTDHNQYFASIDNMCRMLIDALAIPLQIEQHVVRVEASIGVSLVSGETQNAETVFEQADLSMHHAKSTGLAYEIYDPAIHQKAKEVAIVESDLEKAIAKGEIIPYFQPIVNLKSGDIIGYEALARWISPEHGMVSPGKFIPVAELTGQIKFIGKLILNTALNYVQELNEQTHGNLYVSVNVSPMQLMDDELVCWICERFIETKFNPSSLLIEVTEEVSSKDKVGMLKHLKELKLMGVRIACDDFGAGYSSLAQLREMPWDVVKIDRSFLKNEADCPMLAPMIHIAKNLGLPVIIEGVEDQEHVKLMQDLGCDYAQGFYYGKPSHFNELSPQQCSCAQHSVSASSS